MSNKDLPPPYEEMPTSVSDRPPALDTMESFDGNSPVNWSNSASINSSQSSSSTSTITATLPSYPSQSTTLYSEAPADESDLSLEFCESYPIRESQTVYDIQSLDHRKFHLTEPPFMNIHKRFTHRQRFYGDIRSDQGLSIVHSASSTKDCCFVSQLPLYAPQQDIHDGKMYFECMVDELKNHNKSVVALGYCCLPYPPFRLPGWNRGSVAIHSDDGSLFFSNDEHGQPCVKQFNVGETIGIGLDLHNRSLIVTRKGKLEVQVSISRNDPLIVNGRNSIFACVGIFGKVQVSVNFGCMRPFEFTGLL